MLSKGAPAEPNLCGTYAGRLREERLRHEFIQGLKEFRRSRGDRLEALYTTEDRDDGPIAIIEDDGSIVADPNPLDLTNATIRFEPAIPAGYSVSARPTLLDTDMGNLLSLGDDETRQVAFTSGFTFRFFGVAYTELYVNSNGNLTFGRGDARGGVDTGIYGQELSDFLYGPPRIAALFNDLNPASGGGIFVKVQSDRLVVTWNRVFLFAGSTINTFQIILFANGAIELAYSDSVSARQGVVGISPGGSGAPLSVVDFSHGPAAGQLGAIAERFNTQTELDVVALSKKFYKSHADVFEFLATFSNFTFNMGGAFAFELNVSNSARGLGDILIDGAGQDLFDDSRLFGSSGKLESFVVLGPSSSYPSDPSQVFFGTNTVSDLIGQEAGHRWGAFVSARVNGARSQALLGRAQAHWSFFHDTDASDLEGNKIRDNGNGTFTTIEATKRYSQLDQYLMGLRDATEVAPFFFVESPTDTSRSPSSSPATGVTFRGTRRNLTVQDIIAEEGLRDPTPATAPKIFRMAFILVLRSGNQPSTAELDKIKAIGAAWEKHFAQAADNRGFMDTRLVRDERPLVTYLPLLEGDSQRYSAVAVANRAGYPVSVKLTAYADNGQLLRLPDMVNPATLAVGPGQQRALLDAQIFRFGFSEVRQGWIKIESSSDQIAAFFLVGNMSQTYLDGGLAQNQPLTQMTFSRAFEGSAVLFEQATTTEINLVNPGTQSADLQLTLYDGTGRVAATSGTSIPAGGRRRQTLSQIFSGLPLPVSSGYLDVQSTQPLVGFELIQFGQTLYGLPAQAQTSSPRLYSAQFASGGAGVFPAPFFTDLTLVNVGGSTASVSIRLVGEDGALLQLAGIANPLARSIAPRATLSGRADRLFGFPRDDTDTGVRVGSVIVEVSDGTVLGDVTFGDAANGRIVASLPLQSVLISDLVFAQVAEGQSGDPPVGYFTGVAVLNPNPVAVQLTMEVFKETGELAGSQTLALAAGNRLSQTVGQLVPAASGQLRGYIRVRATGGSVAIFELFGDTGLSLFLSAVPPQVIAPP